MTYTTDNTFINSAEVPDGWEVTTTDRSDYESNILDKETWK